MLKLWLKIDGRIQVRSALHGLHVCQGFIKIGKSGSSALSFSPSFILALVCLAGWLCIHHQVMQKSGSETDWAKAGHSALPPSGDRPTHYLNLAISRPLVHVVRNVSARYLSVYHFLIPMSHVRFVGVSVISTLILSILRLLAASLLW
jgi:hypothetical protein